MALWHWPAPHSVTAPIFSNCLTEGTRSHRSCRTEGVSRHSQRPQCLSQNPRTASSRCEWGICLTKCARPAQPGGCGHICCVVCCGVETKTESLPTTAAVGSTSTDSAYSNPRADCFLSRLRARSHFGTKNLHNLVSPCGAAQAYEDGRVS